MAYYSTITILYNPNSTGPVQDLAKELAAKLRRTLYAKKLTLMPTEYAGHAEKLAYRLAKESNRPLIIIVSGDGGYHEVINGALKAQQEGARVTTALLPGGNANDHYNFLHTGDLVECILEQAEQQIDVLQVTATGKKHWQRYAHSYAGVGLTPHAGRQLNKTSLSRLAEMRITIWSFIRFRPVVLTVDGQTASYDHLVLSNIGRMAKLLKLSSTASVTDGLFEVTATRHHTKLPLLFSLGAAAGGVSSASTETDQYGFICRDKTNLQLDGEVYSLLAGSSVSVTIAPQVLRCII